MDILKDISVELAASMPEVSQHAIEEHEAQERKNDANLEQAAPTVSNQNNWPLDKNGTPYNPATHVISPLTGKAIKKKQSGSKKSSVVASGKTATQASPINEAEQQGKACGQVAASLTVTVCMGLGGEEFAPKEGEFQTLEAAFGNYFISTGKTDLPPSMVLIAALGMYIAPRLVMPKTQSRLGAAKDWVASKFLAWRGRKTMSSANKQASEQAGQ